MSGELKRKLGLYGVVLLFVIGGIVSASGLAAAAATNLNVVSPSDTDGDGNIEVRSAASDSASTIRVTVDVTGADATFTFDDDQNAGSFTDQGVNGTAGNVTVADGSAADLDSTSGTITTRLIVDGGGVSLTEGTIDLIVTEGNTQSQTPDQTKEFQVDNTAPTVNLVTTRDNGDGTGTVIGGSDDNSPNADNGEIDQLVVYFDENINDNSVTYSDFSVDSGFDRDSIKTGSSANDNKIIVELKESGSGDTGTTPTLDISSGNLADEAGNAISTVSKTATDSAAPAMTAASTADANNNGTVDQINVTMSESLDDLDSTFDGTTFESVSSATVGDASSGGTADDDKIDVVVTGTTSNDTSITLSSLKLNSAKLEDKNTTGNSLSSDQTLSTVSDGAAPTFKTLSTADANNNGYVDELSVTFTEAIASDEVAPGDLSIGTASGLDGATSVNSDSGDDGDDTVTIGLSEGQNTFDTDATPKLQYTDDGNGDGDQIQDGNGNAMVSIESETASDGAGPGITSFQATNPGGQNVNVSIDTGEQLGGSAGDIAVSITGAETANLNRNDFTEYGSGPYTYATTYDGSSDGTYKTTLDTAQDAIGNDGANSESSSASVDTSTPASSSSPPTTSYSGTSVSRQEGGTIEQNSETDTASVSLSQASSVQSITFDSASVSGSVSVRELSSAPSDVSSAPGTHVSATEIVVPDTAKDTSATIRLRVPADDVDTDATQLQINRYNDGSQTWEALSTEVTSQTDEQISLKAETPGFSLFTVSAVEEQSSDGTEGETDTDAEEGNETDTDTESDTEETDDTVDDTADGIPGFGFSVSLVALVAIALIARRKQR